jgi:hypothetical protein
VTLRVVHCGTGNVGVAGLQGILNHPDLEPVGHRRAGDQGHPAVCAADAGLKGPLDIPRYHTRNARRA